MNGKAIFCGLVLASGSAPGLTAQGLSAALSLERPFYWNGDYRDTNGDWQVETTLRYRFDGSFRIGLGAGGGKLDEAFSDPSLSFFWIHLEPSLITQLSRSSSVWVGARYGWAHERVGDRDEGFWAWGWLGGAAGGVDYALSDDLGIGLQLDVTRLNLRRDEIGVAAPGGLDREGWRVSVGPVLTFGGA